MNKIGSLESQLMDAFKEKEEKEVVEEAKEQLAELTEKVLKKRRDNLIKEDVAKIADQIKETSSEREIVLILKRMAEGEITA